MLSRSALREKVFVLLFESQFNDPADMPEQARLYLTESEEACDDESAAYIEDRFNSIIKTIPTLDELIQEHSSGWSLDRIGKVELSVLRLAVWELKFDDDIPAGVAINEAVNLAKKYGQDGAGSFINGILANFAD
ncbi:MAG: transcription antitermination factor NusB [Lachnospiraceae bacterium]|nr:transcription antitermination factor NusB [Lachnospiraceae bacterium]